MERSDLVMTGATFSEVLPLVLEHHYSQRRTADPMFCFAWRLPGGLLGDTGRPVAAIIFTSPANKYFGKGAIELSRLVRDPAHKLPPLSSFVAWALRWLRSNTLLAYCLSYADQGAGHHGGIYQALNFIHVAQSRGNYQYKNNESGQITSGRSFDQRNRINKRNMSRQKTAPKYLYVFPLNEPRDELLERFGWTPLPYPKPDLVTP